MSKQFIQLLVQFALFGLVLGLQVSPSFHGKFDYSKQNIW